MPRPVSQYFSLPFNRHCIRSPPRCSPKLCRMPVVRHRRPVERKARAGRHSHPAQLRSRPPRASTSIPHAGAQAFGAAMRPVSNSDTILMRPSAGCPASTWSAPGGHTGGGGSRPPGRKPHTPRCTPTAPGLSPLHPRITRPDPAASPQRPACPRCTPAAPGQIPLHPRSALSRISPWGKFFV